MKTCLLILALFAAGCVTTTAPDGTKTHQVDKRAANTVGRVFGALLTGYLQSQGVPVNYDAIVTDSGKQIVPFER